MDARITDDIFIEEKIDGKIYCMARPSDEHVDIQGNIGGIFNDYFRKNKKKCIARIEAQLWINKENWVVPDVMIFCYNTNKYIPMIVVEIMSKSTRDKDTGIKMKKYAELGVGEYWTIDSGNRILDIYLAADNKTYKKQKTYIYYSDKDFCPIPDIREEQKARLEITEKFSPASIPGMTVRLEDIFYFIDEMEE